MTSASIITVQGTDVLSVVKTLNAWWTLESTVLPYVTTDTEEVPVAVQIETSRGDKFVSPHTYEDIQTLGTWDIPKLKAFLESDDLIYRT